MSPIGDPDFNLVPNSEATNRMLMAGGAYSATGRWVWATGFEDGADEIDQTPTAGTISIVTSNVYMGRQALSLKPTTGNGDSVTVSKNLRWSRVVQEWEAFGPPFTAPQDIPNKTGIEVLVKFILTNGSEFNWEIRSAGYSLAAIRYNTSGFGQIGTFYYLTSSGSYQAFANVNVDYFSNNSIWHYTKLVADMNRYAPRYTYFVFDGIYFDLSTIASQRPGTWNPNIPAGGVRYEMSAKNLTAGSQFESVIDNLVITQDEP